MAEKDRALSDLEKEAAFSWREWPIYVVMRLKRLNAIQEQLRVSGSTESQLIRREELLKAIHDLDDNLGEEPLLEEPQPAGEEYRDSMADEQVDDSEYAVYEEQNDAESSSGDYSEEVTYEEE